MNTRNFTSDAERASYARDLAEWWPTPRREPLGFFAVLVAWVLGL